MKISRLLIFSFLFVSGFLSAQTKEVLFTIDNHPYYNDEFVRVYNKNLDLVKDDSQKDLDKYLDLFLGYKLKVEKANKIGLQNGLNYQNELKSYRNQLSKNYVNDSKVTNELVKEAYDRMQQEVRASHILVLVDEGALPQDTLKAYNKVIEIKRRLDAGEDFITVAQQTSEDPSVKENNGDLGYFSAFRMVYPFENAAYNTKVGQVSKPFRTRFGYHIVKVVDKRVNRGEVTVAHIMIVKQNDAAQNEKAKTTIDDIYKKIQQGEAFESLAQQFSEDKSSAPKGGVLQRFGSGQLSSEEFENVAFELKEKDQISVPFQSQFGWHIVKLIEKHPVRSFDEMKFELEEKIRKDERSLLITNSLAKKLRDKYTITKDAKIIAKIKAAVNDDFYSQTWVVPEKSKELNGDVLVINKDKKINAKLFLDFIAAKQKSNIKTKPIVRLVDELFEKFTEEQLIAYYNENLENEFTEFKNVMDEYRDGLLLFDLMEKEIWNRAKNDTIGLHNYFANNIKNYQWKKRYSADILSSTDKKIVEKAQKFLKKGKSLEYIREQLNKDGKVNIMSKSGMYEEDYDVLSQFENLSKGVTSIVSKDQYFFVVNITDEKPAGAKELSECKGKAISDYQQYLENNWVDELKSEFSIQVNQDVFAKVKSQLKN
ncbi:MULTISPECIES: peptidylprolyl isomerase [unclassified Flavobacterium]|uniref:peptidylprolyl isomerase n=1 Tax=unclassified Flavobacterium TaxID=196869 RepID=UPI001291B11B|nr:MULTISPECIES: peptidylprolyl isomerase [unclassified Flavobacterium]MQP52877.1 peptidylprolyl isomerase [Flavobacterium sp. LMO9]MQP63234.1 peptidylprolyl isomerase [Flavobacterium sp. LMO6]